MAEIDDVWKATRLALLQQISELVKDGPDAFAAAAALDLAEAYAWLTSVAQPHGGRTSPYTGRS